MSFAIEHSNALYFFGFRMHAPIHPVKIKECVNQDSPGKDIGVCVLMVGQVEHVTLVRLKLELLTIRFS